jgi:hypothetical protein
MDQPSIAAVQALQEILVLLVYIMVQILSYSYVTVLGPIGVQ